jgi:hypothetical protein
MRTKPRRERVTMGRAAASLFGKRAWNFRAAFVPVPSEHRAGRLRVARLRLRRSREHSFVTLRHRHSIIPHAIPPSSCAERSKWEAPGECSRHPRVHNHHHGSDSLFSVMRLSVIALLLAACRVSRARARTRRRPRGQIARLGRDAARAVNCEPSAASPASSG